MSQEAETLVPTMLDSEPIAVEKPVPRLQPVAANERVGAVDMLRGFALLGILAMNIVWFGWPPAAYENPTRGGGFEGTDRIIWVFNHLFFDMKMMTLFSMLFGAGLVLMGERSKQRGASLAGLYYRRCLWLLVIGLIHAYLLWSGDILVLYAECGLIIYLFRRWWAWAQLLVGFLFLCMVVPIVLGFAAGLDFLEKTAEKAEAAEKAHEQPTRFEAWIYHDVWKPKIVPKFDPNAPKKKKDFEKSIETHRGGYLGIVKERATWLFFGHTLGFVLGGFWLAGGRMLIGMGLMKLGVFSGQRSRGFYLWMLILGYGIGLPLVAYDTFQSIQNNFDFKFQIHGGIFLNFFGSVLVALGHVSALLLIYKAGLITWLTSRLAAVGRMALTNYLTQSIVFSTLFLRVWPGFIWVCQPDRPGGHGGGHVDLSNAGQQDVAGTVPVRACGVGLAVVDLLEVSAHATPGRANEWPFSHWYSICIIHSQAAFSERPARCANRVPTKEVSHGSEIRPQGAGRSSRGDARTQGRQAKERQVGQKSGQPQAGRCHRLVQGP